MFHKLVRTIVIAFTVTLAASSYAQQAETAPKQEKPEYVPELLVKANAAFAAKDYGTFRDKLKSLHKLRPNNSDYMYQLVIAYALLNEKTPAYNLMLKMQQQGLAYDFTESEHIENIRGTEVFEYINDLLVAAENPMGEAEPVFVLPDSVAMPETITWDESRQKFLIGTVTEGQILSVDKDGQVTELLKANNENGMWGVMDIQVDQARNRLWVTSASTSDFLSFDPIDKGRSALFEFDLKSLELIKRYPIPVDGRPHILGSMVIDPNGSVYIADRYLPFVYSKPTGEDKLKAVMVLEGMVSMRGIAMQPDGRVMYVADREMGIMVVDVVGKRARLLEVPETLNAGGIDGLYLEDNRLFIIQNGIKPQRVMRLQLDSSGTSVVSVAPLAVAQPQFDMPSFGVIKGKDLYYFANSQWVGKKGPQKPVTVLRSPLDLGVDLVTPEMSNFLKRQAESKKQEVENN